MTDWNPEQYRRFAAERAQPFHDLLALIERGAIRRAVDLGCGPGELTALATVVFDLIGFLMTGQWWDIPALLGAKLGFGIGGGVVAHYANGVILALIYTGLAPLLWGPAWSTVSPVPEET